MYIVTDIGQVGPRPYSLVPGRPVATTRGSGKRSLPMVLRTGMSTLVEITPAFRTLYRALVLMHGRLP